jgi:hypothetical protein
LVFLDRSLLTECIEGHDFCTAYQLRPDLSLGRSLQNILFTRKDPLPMGLLGQPLLLGFDKA